MIVSLMWCGQRQAVGVGGVEEQEECDSQRRESGVIWIQAVMLFEERI